MTSLDVSGSRVLTTIPICSSKLEYLKIDGTSIGDLELEVILRNCPNITVISAKECQRFQNPQINGKALVELCLRGCVSLLRTYIIAPSLQYIDLKGTTCVAVVNGTIIQTSV